MAVAAHEGSIYVYTLDTMKSMRQDLRNGSSFHPIREVSYGEQLNGCWRH